MSTLGELQSQIDALKAEVARLREETELFFIIHRDDDGSVIDTQIKCWLVNCEIVNVRARGGNKMGAWISADEEGAYIALNDKEEKQRVRINAMEGRGALEIVGADGKPVVSAFERDGHGYVVVFSPGHVPRALMKAMDTGGALTVTAEDGNPRAVVLSIDGKGKMALLGEEGAQIELNTGEQGGVLMVRNGEGKNGIGMTAAAAGSSVFLINPEGEKGVSLATTAAGSIVSVGGNPGTDKQRSPIELSDLPGVGAYIAMRARDGTESIGIDAGQEAGGASVKVSAPGTEVKLDIRDGGGRVVANRTGDTISTALLTAGEHGGMIEAGGPDQKLIAIAVGPNGGNLTVADAGQPVLVAGAGVDEKNRSFLQLVGKENAAVVQLFAGEHGGTALVTGNDGTTQAGFTATESGGDLSVFNELGVERAALRSAADGGGLHLKWGGTTGVVAAATESGGLITAHGPDGQVVQTFPDPERFALGDESTDED